MSDAVHVFMLVFSLAAGQPYTVVESNKTFPTVEACKAGMDAVVDKVNEVIAPNQLVVTKALCDTEAGFKQRAAKKTGI